MHAQHVNDTSGRVLNDIRGSKVYELKMKVTICILQACRASKFGMFTSPREDLLVFLLPCVIQPLDWDFLS